MCFCEYVNKTENITLFEGFRKELPWDDLLNLSQGICKAYPLLASTLHFRITHTHAFKASNYSTLTPLCSLFSRNMICYSSKCNSSVIWFFSSDESICREPRHSAIWNEQNIDRGFFAVFCKAIEKEFYTLTPRASSYNARLIPCSSLTGSALEVLLRIRYSMFKKITSKSTVTKGLTQNTWNQWKDPQQLQRVLHHATKEMSIPGNVFI